jgi:hypothetical protein
MDIVCQNIEEAMAILQKPIVVHGEDVTCCVRLMIADAVVAKILIRALAEGETLTLPPHEFTSF